MSTRSHSSQRQHKYFDLLLARSDPDVNVFLFAAKDVHHVVTFAWIFLIFESFPWIFETIPWTFESFPWIFETFYLDI